jgi:hypothetical protein
MRALLFSLLVLLSISACGPKWYYPHLDWLLPWYVSDYITLAPAQRTELQRRLVRQLDWHCRSELPVYAAFLRKVQQDVEKQTSGFSKQQIRLYYTNIRFLYNNLIINVAPDLAAILRTASDAQIEELFANLEARNRELAARYVDPPPAMVTQERYERMSERLAEWIGALDQNQLAMVEDWSRDLGADNAPWLANRRQFQQGLRRLLADRGRRSDFTPQLAALIASPPQTESYRRRHDRRTALTLDLLTGIGNTLSPGQRRHLASRLEALADDFEDLACGADP